MKVKSKEKKICGKHNLPKNIVLLGKTYKIKQMSCKKCDGSHIGIINFQNGTIELCKNLNKFEAERVLLHELGHYFADYYYLEDSEMFADAFERYFKLIIKQLRYVRK